MPDPHEAVRRYRRNLQAEVDGEALYRALADSESEPNLADVYRKLSAIEAAHKQFWQAKLGAGEDTPRPSFRARTLGWLSRRFGAGVVLPTVVAAETRDSAAYDGQSEAAAAGLPADERSHRRIVRAVEAASGGLSGSAIAGLEGRHSAVAGNALRAAVLGANDGLVSNLSLVMGMAGALGGGRAVLLAGLAGLVAGSCSMAMGEWLSVNSAREMADRQIATEAEEMAESPDEERQELMLIYQAKGLTENLARQLADDLLSNKETALDTLTREELGIDPAERGGSPWQAATASFFLFAVGAVFPVAPFFFLQGAPAVVAALALSGVAMAGIGAATSLFTGRGVVFSAARQLAIGFMAAAVTYAVGRLVGVAVS